MDLKIGIAECKISCENIETVASKMESYISEIILFNSAYNLTNTSDHDELVVRHVLDSLAGYPEIKKIVDKKNSEGAEKVLVGDIGSGGGLPGIPLAAAFLQNEKVKIDLVERMSKRCAFLENCVAICGLKNAEVICTEAGRIPEQTYDIITFRAFRPLDEKMAKTLLRIVKAGGVLCAYKAKIENIKEEMSCIKNLIPEYEVKKLNVPGMSESERNLVLIHKK